MTADEVIKEINKTYKGLELHEAWGERSFFYNPDSKLKRGTYFFTVKEKDGENDKASNLDREDIYRINFALDKTTFENIFQ